MVTKKEEKLLRLYWKYDLENVVMLICNFNKD